MDKEPPFREPSRETPRTEPQLTNLQKAEFIRGVELFSAATVEELFRLASIAREIQFGAGEIVARENDMANALYVIVQGKVELSSRNDAWQDLLESGQAFGMHSLLTREPLTFTARAVADTFALAMGGEDFFSLLSNDPEILSSLFKFFVKKYGMAR
ncbi:MAG: cyclic nucleotide-binding domain-containing protein [Acidobacteria bacterium]|nr:cyclic nucleotide-binding domain-containing protein [Acidobacteriota bacterium]